MALTEQELYQYIGKNLRQLDRPVSSKELSYLLDELVNFSAGSYQSALDGLSNVSITTPSNGQLLVYNSGISLGYI